jgi:radical SAM enzyme (TIGR01210 family)
MSLLAPLCQQLHQKYHPKPRSPTQPISFWREKDRLNNEISNAYVIILGTRGCSWAHKSGCSMCGYINDSHWNGITDKDILTQLQNAMVHYQNEPIIKLFNSGSFFDPQEISQKLQQQLLSHLKNNAKKITIESRPQFITEHNLKNLQNSVELEKIEVGIGLETANDLIRTHAINKGFTYKNYQNAVTKLLKRNIKIKTYLLIKPPLITEQESIEDTLQSVKTIKNHSSTISFNPCNVQRHTVAEYLWKRQSYRPPWLWTIITILQKSKQLTTTRLQCDISGGGTPRGPHNCPQCNTKCLEAIKQFSLTQNTKYFTNLDCKCKQIWKTQCTNEHLTFGSIIDYQKELL